MQFKETDRFGPEGRRWADLSWELSQLSVSNRCKTVLQKGPCFVTRYFRIHLYNDLEQLYEDILLHLITPAQAFAYAADKLHVYHEEYHKLVSSDLYTEAMILNPGSFYYHNGLMTVLNDILQ